VAPSCWMRRLLYAAGGLVLVVVIVIGLTQASGKNKTENVASFNLPQAQKQLETAPAPLNGLYEQANELLGGGTSAFTARLGQLKGHPLVINKWASWCGPCVTEFPIFENVASQRGTSVGFIGLNVNDANSHAKAFLAKRPLPFPSYADPSEKLTASIAAPLKIAPVTIFLGRDGKIATIHTGPYQSTKQLNDDITHYLG
jgi:cytochrome c biogenesis protein CcmG/thiol:disulfide interchange protein DsbE